MNAPEPTSPPQRSPARVPSRRVGFVTLAAGVVVLVAAAWWVAAGRPAARPPVLFPGDRTPGYLVSIPELRERARLATAGVEPYAEAVEDLLDVAGAAAEEPARPEEPLDIDGTEGAFVEDSAAAYGLALAWGVTQEPRYAEAAAARIMAWVDTTRTTRDACPDGGQCQTALIISRTAPGFVFAADLIAGSGALQPEDETALRAWLATVILPAASRLENNWGDAGAFTAVVLTDYLGDRAGLIDALERWRVQADRIAADGHLPEETRRGSGGINYTQEALQYRVGVAAVAERFGLDLWTFRGTGGATLEEAIDYLARYWSRPEAWPWHDDAKVPSTGPLWEIAYAHDPDPAYVPIILDRRPFGEQGHSALRWTTLTHGIPIEDTAVGTLSGE